MNGADFIVANDLHLEPVTIKSSGICRNALEKITEHLGFSSIQNYLDALEEFGADIWEEAPIPDPR